MKKKKKQENFDKRWKILMISLMVIFTGMWYSNRKEKIDLDIKQQKIEKTMVTEKEAIVLEKSKIEAVENQLPENMDKFDDMPLASTGKEDQFKKININTASAEELMLLPGIGEALSKSIISYREESGGFKSIEEIKNVKRIGEKTFEKFKEKITVSDD